MMKKPTENSPGHIYVSRRGFLTDTARLALALGLSRTVPWSSVLAQTGTKSNKLIVRSENPQDLETPINLLDTWITPNDLFYVRSHIYTPKVDMGTWRLQIDGMVNQPLTLTLDDLKKYPESMQVVTLECSGNGRAFYEPTVPGAQWEKGAVGNARWTGVRLADVLKHAGVKPGAKYITIDGADVPMGKVPDFIRSLPIEKAMHPDTLLAMQMNGEPIPVSHGFPLRLIASGWTGNNSVKWVTHITVADQPTDAFFYKTAYRYPTMPVAPGATVDAANMVPLTTLAVKSSITAPSPAAQFKPGPVMVKGIAYAGEADIVSVDVSTDLGATWKPATLGRDHARYAWRLWEYNWTASNPGSYLIMSRAKDSTGRIQPMVQAWNPSGYLWNVADKVRVTVAP
ncbi:MAG TPA: sulfite oxidase [Blastocatellia bacterium]|nr:sulfite oxidase [Blastocatellia bacterium]